SSQPLNEISPNPHHPPFPLALVDVRDHEHELFFFSSASVFLRKVLPVISLGLCLRRFRAKNEGLVKGPFKTEVVQFVQERIQPVPLVVFVDINVIWRVLYGVLTGLPLLGIWVLLVSGLVTLIFLLILSTLSLEIIDSLLNNQNFW
ncbi:hypothetical protein Tco_0871282, partial [Tanacetum coccineum]